MSKLHSTNYLCVVTSDEQLDKENEKRSPMKHNQFISMPLTQDSVSALTDEELKTLKEDMYKYDITTFSEQTYGQLISVYKKLSLDKKIKFCTVISHYKTNLDMKIKCQSSQVYVKL